MSTTTVADQWATSRNGKLSIRCFVSTQGWSVYALRAGTHELAPRSRSFGADEQAARDYANSLWRG